MTKYAVTGATGHFGQNALKELVKLVPATDVIALARNTQKAESMVPEGVEVRTGDYTDGDQLTESLKDIDRLLFISSQPGGPVARLTQHQNVVKAAENAGVGYIAYTSFPHADKATVSLAADHKETEKLIQASGMKYSFLRNNWYLENDAAGLKAATKGNEFIYSAGDGKVGWALESEYSEAAAKVLAAKETKAVYEFAGESRTYAELAATVSGNFKVTSLTDTEYSKLLKDSGMDEGTIGVIISIQDLIADGALFEETTDFPDVLGHNLVPISEAIKTVVGE